MIRFPISSKTAGLLPAVFGGDPPGNGVCFAHCWLDHPMLRIRYRSHRSSLETVRRTVFLSLRPSRVRFPFSSKTAGIKPAVFGGDPPGNGVCFAHCWLDHPMLRIRYRSHRSSLETVRRTVFLSLRPSRVRFPISSKTAGLLPAVFGGDPPGNRTPDTLIKRQVVFSSNRSYIAIFKFMSHKMSHICQVHECTSILKSVCNLFLYSSQIVI